MRWDRIVWFAAFALVVAGCSPSDPDTSETSIGPPLPGGAITIHPATTSPLSQINHLANVLSLLDSVAAGEVRLLWGDVVATGAISTDVLVTDAHDLPDRDVGSVVAGEPNDEARIGDAAAVFACPHGVCDTVVWDADTGELRTGGQGLSEFRGGDIFDRLASPGRTLCQFTPKPGPTGDPRAVIEAHLDGTSELQQVAALVEEREERSRVAQEVARAVGSRLDPVAMRDTSISARDLIRQLRAGVPFEELIVRNNVIAYFDARGLQSSVHIMLRDAVNLGIVGGSDFAPGDRSGDHDFLLTESGAVPHGHAVEIYAVSDDIESCVDGVELARRLPDEAELLATVPWNDYAGTRRMLLNVETGEWRGLDSAEIREIEGDAPREWFFGEVVGVEALDGYAVEKSSPSFIAIGPARVSLSDGSKLRIPKGFEWRGQFCDAFPDAPFQKTGTPCFLSGYRLQGGRVDIMRPLGYRPQMETTPAGLVSSSMTVAAAGDGQVIFPDGSVLFESEDGAEIMCRDIEDLDGLVDPMPGRVSLRFWLDQEDGAIERVQCLFEF